MISSGISSNLSAYLGTSNSVYSVSPASSVEKQSESVSVEQKSAIYPEIKDEAFVSDEAKQLLASESAKDSDKTAESDNQSKTEQDVKTGASAQAKQELTPEEKQQVSELKARDVEVKTHEAAHRAAAAGISASAPSYSYQTGPDGKKYAIGGEVSISFSKTGNPASDIASAQAMKAAALAPAQPSGQDFSVARSADRMIAEFRDQMAQEQAEVLNTKKTDKDDEDSSIETTSSTANIAPVSTSQVVAEDSSGVPRMT